jgi:hypothetical protein
VAVTKPGVVLGMAYEQWGSFQRSRQKAIMLEAWERGEQYQIDPDGELWDEESGSKYGGRPFKPRGVEVTDEYDDLSERAPNALAGLLVTTLAQTAFVEGVRRPNVKGNLNAWATWQANRMDMKQGSIHREVDRLRRRRARR